MVDIDNLLAKYFNATSTIVEEVQLKSYFLSDNVKEQHLAYKSLFEVFNDESIQKLPHNNQKKTIQTTKSLLWWSRISASGIAASLVLGVWLMNTNVSADYAYVNGQRFDKKEIVEQLANQKIEYVNELLDRTLKPVNEFSSVRESLKPIHSIKETDHRLNDIKLKISGRY
ncbi:MAG: hypothetical protein JXR27_13595 [Paludibacteraceae bacterium]|nr:hypothetical protein [Paludibacteraceae bacterium]